MAKNEELLTSRPTPKLEDYPLSVVRHCLFNIFAAALQDESTTEVKFFVVLRISYRDPIRASSSDFIEVRRKKCAKQMGNFELRGRGRTAV
jgi:hypothetical protein